MKLAHPSHVKAIASARVKTDKIDARILAHLLRTDLAPEAWAPPPRTRELRDLVRLRYAGTDLFGRRGRAWLAVAELDPHARALTELLLTSIAEADAHVAALTARLHELLDGDSHRRPRPARAVLDPARARGGVPGRRPGRAR